MQGGRLGCGMEGEGAAPEGVARPLELPALRDAAVASVACGQGHAGCVTEQGRVYLWGANDSCQLGLGVAPGAPGFKAQVWHPMLLRGPTTGRTGTPSAVNAAGAASGSGARASEGDLGEQPDSTTLQGVTGRHSGGLSRVAG